MEEIDPKAGWREQAIKAKLNNRKERLNEIISKKRLYPVQKQNQSAQQEHKISEGEKKKEEKKQEKVLEMQISTPHQKKLPKNKMLLLWQVGPHKIKLLLHENR